jgi:hypothetical protein
MRKQICQECIGMDVSNIIMEYEYDFSTLTRELPLITFNGVIRFLGSRGDRSVLYVYEHCVYELDTKTWQSTKLCDNYQTFSQPSESEWNVSNNRGVLSIFYHEIHERNWCPFDLQHQVQDFWKTESEICVLIRMDVRCYSIEWWDFPRMKTCLGACDLPGIDYRSSFSKLSDHSAIFLGRRNNKNCIVTATRKNEMITKPSNILSLFVLENGQILFQTNGFRFGRMK